MRAERAFFTSDQDRDIRGYQLVARSPGIDDDLAQRIIAAAPTHDSLEGTSPQTCSLNYTHVGQWAILSRTTYGGPEYSNRGSFRIVTSFLVAPLAELAGYGSNPYLLSRVATALGLLTCPWPINRNLESVEILDQSLLAEFGRIPPGGGQSRLVQILCDSLGDTRPVVISGALDPGVIVQQLYSVLAEEVRLWVSYSTCLKPSINRPYRLQFCGPCDARRISLLESRGFRCLQAQ